MKYKFLNPVILTTYLAVGINGINCTSREKTEVADHSKTPADSGFSKSQISIHTNETGIENIDAESFLRWYLIPNIERLYQKASLGYIDDHFNKLREALETEYPFLFHGSVSNWDEFLSNASSFLKRTKSKFKLRYHMVTLTSGLVIPTVTIYELIQTQDKEPPIEAMSELWQIDFRDTFPPQTTFRVDYAKEPLVLPYDLWQQKMQQAIILEGVTHKKLREIVLFVDETELNPILSKNRSLTHEFSHILFDKKTEHLTSFELKSYALFVRQTFVGGAETTISFTYLEFDELMAKLSELIVVPDENLYEYINEVTINKTPRYQKLRQLIASTTVYKYLADEHPEQFQKLRHRMITDQELKKYLLQLSQEKTDNGENKLRSYLKYHVNSVGKSLKNVVFQ